MTEGEGFDPGRFELLASVEEGNFWFEVRNELIVWAIGRYAVATDDYLEIGCGTGFVFTGVGRAYPGMRLTGTELFAEGLEFARERVPGAELLQMDARELPYEAEFDVVGAFDVLEHIKEDQAVLGQMTKALRPGGLLLATVPQHRWLWSAHDQVAMHERRYVRRELVRKVEAAGLEVERVTSFVSLLLPLMAASRVRRRDGALEDENGSEFEIGERANAVLTKVMRFELNLIKRGVSFPAGGSLLLAARKPGASDARDEPHVLEEVSREGQGSLQ